MTDTDNLVELLRGWWEDPTEAMTGREVYVDDLMQAAANEIERLRSEIDDLRCSVCAFGGPAMVEWARMHALPEGHLFPSHYDILARAGARMDDFTRHAPPEAART